MTIKETYDFLYRVRNIERQTEVLKAKREALRMCLLPQGIRYDLDKVQTTPTDRVSEIEADIADISRELEDLSEQKYEQIKAVSLAIAKLEDDAEQVVLTCYYIGKMPMTKVAEIIQYSLRNTYKIKKRAVQHLSKVCKKCS